MKDARTATTTATAAAATFVVRADDDDDDDDDFIPYCISNKFWFLNCNFSL